FETSYAPNRPEIIYCETCGIVPVPESDLPVRLPEKLENYKPEGKSPLADVPDFVNAPCPKCGTQARRETDTMDTFVCSSWYWMRYLDSQNSEQPFSFDEEFLKKWLPVGMYIGGIEHACMHLLYARFVNMVLYDLNYIPNEEPFAKLRHQGLIIKDGAKMSKSRGNVVNPDEFVEKYGADVFRMYLLFMGPYEEGGDFSDRGIVGVRRFIEKAERLVNAGKSPQPPLKKGEQEGSFCSPLSQRGVRGDFALPLVHRTIKHCEEAYAHLRFNTAIAKLMEYVNWWGEEQQTGKLQPVQHRFVAETFLKILAPLAPHTTEELWHQLGHTDSIHQQTWPAFDQSQLVDATFELILQVNGKVRAKVEAARGSSNEELEKLALENDRVKEFSGGKAVKKVIVVADKLVNVVVG
ncbi:MAG: class I tRNA ligase family protein, partial [bacterium]